MKDILLLDNLDINEVGSIALIALGALFLISRFMKMLKKGLIERKWDTYTVPAKLIEVNQRTTFSRGSNEVRRESHTYDHTYEFEHPISKVKTIKKSEHSIKHPGRTGGRRDIVVRLDPKGGVYVYESVKDEVKKPLLYIITIIIVATCGIIYYLNT